MVRTTFGGSRGHKTDPCRCANLQAPGAVLKQVETPMRQNVTIAVVAATIGLSLLSAAPAAAMPVASTVPVAATALPIETVGYYGYGYGYYSPHYRNYYYGQQYGYYYRPRYYAPRHYYRPYWGYGYGRRWGY